MDAVIQNGGVVWKDEGNFFSLEREIHMVERGNEFVKHINGRDLVLTKQARAILSRDNVDYTTHCFNFHILKGAFVPSNERSTRHVTFEVAPRFGFRVPLPRAVRLFLTSIGVCDMETMGFKNIILPCEEKVRGGIFCRLIISRRRDYVVVGTYIEEKSDKWNEDTGFLFVA